MRLTTFDLSDATKKGLDAVYKDVVKKYPDLANEITKDQTEDICVLFIDAGQTLMTNDEIFDLALEAYKNHRIPLIRLYARNLKMRRSYYRSLVRNPLFMKLRRKHPTDPVACVRELLEFLGALNERIRNMSATNSAALDGQLGKVARPNQYGMQVPIDDPAQATPQEALNLVDILFSALLKNQLSGISGGQPGSAHELLRVLEKEIVDCVNEYAADFNAKDFYIRHLAMTLGGGQHEGVSFFAKKSENESNFPGDEMDVGFGDDASRMMPRELQTEEDAFYNKVASGELQEKTYLNASDKRQCMIIAVDGSSSMEGPKTLIASAIVLSLLEGTYKRRDMAFVIPFDRDPHPPIVVSDGKSAKTVLDILKSTGIYTGGGTNISNLLHSTLTLIRKAQSGHSAEVLEQYNVAIQKHIMPDGKAYAAVSERQLRSIGDAEMLIITDGESHLDAPDVLLDMMKKQDDGSRRIPIHTLFVAENANEVSRQSVHQAAGVFLLAHSDTVSVLQCDDLNSFDLVDIKKKADEAKEKKGL